MVVDSGSSAMFSRSVPGMGKCSATAKTLIPDQLKDDFIRKARDLGFDGEADALRELIAVFTYGLEHVESMHLQRIRAMAGVVREPSR